MGFSGTGQRLDVGRLVSVVLHEFLVCVCFIKYVDKVKIAVTVAILAQGTHRIRAHAIKVRFWVVGSIPASVSCRSYAAACPSSWRFDFQKYMHLHIT